VIVKGKPALIAFGVLGGGLVLAAILMSVDLVFLAIIAGMSSIPLAFIAWVMAGDNYY
jgi:hypothetical protein